MSGISAANLILSGLKDRAYDLLLPVFMESRRKEPTTIGLTIYLSEYPAFSAVMKVDQTTPIHINHMILDPESRALRIAGGVGDLREGLFRYQDDDLDTIDAMMGWVSGEMEKRLPQTGVALKGSHFRKKIEFDLIGIIEDVLCGTSGMTEDHGFSIDRSRLQIKKSLSILEFNAIKVGLSPKQSLVIEVEATSSGIVLISITAGRRRRLGGTEIAMLRIPKIDDDYAEMAATWVAMTVHELIELLKKAETEAA